MYLMTRQIVYLRLLAGVLSTVVIVSVAKRLTKEPRPSEVGCSLLNDRDEITSGFPSGHVAAVTAFTVMHAQYGLGLVWIILMSWARVAKNCHTIRQVLGGVFAGVFTGVVLGYGFMKR